MIKKILRFISLLDNQTKKKFLLLIILVFLGSLVEIFSFGSIMPMIDVIINEKNSFFSNYGFIKEFIQSYDNKLELLLYLTFLISIIFVLKNIYLIFLLWFNAKTINNIRIFLCSVYLNQILINPYSYHLKNDSSQIIRNSIGEVSIVAKHLLFPTTLIILDILTFIGLVALISFTNFEASVLIFITIILFGFIYISIFKKKLSKFGKIRLDEEQNKIRTVQESLRLIKIVSIKNLVDFVVNRYVTADLKTLKSGVFNTVVLNSIRFLLEIVMVLLFLLLIFLAFINDYNINDLLTYLIFLGVFFIRLLPSVNKFMVVLNNYNYYGKSLDNIYNDISEFELNLTKAQKKKILLENNFKNSIKLNDASFSFGDKKIFENINLEIKKNSITVISGANGQGKSTLINILLGLLPLNSGVYLIDGKEVDIMGYNLSYLVGYMPQEINLIDDNIANNIALGKNKDEIDYDSIDNISKILKFDEFLIERLKDKDFIIGENGQNLSGGQRQKIVLARTLYGNPSIIIMDEPTNSLDHENIELFYNLISTLKENKTLIIITHDQEIKNLSNKNYHIKNGRLQTEE